MSSIFIYPPTNGQSGGGGTGNITVVDNLSSTSSTDALSAFQGNVLDKKITAQSDSFDLKLTDLNTKLEEQSLKIASTTQLGNVKIDGDTVKIKEDGTIYVDKVADNAIFEIHELLLPTTHVGQTQWEIPSQYYANGDTLIVTYNTTVLDSNMYTLDNTTGVTLLNIPEGNGMPIANNQVYLFIFHNKIQDPNFTIYQKVLETNIVSQKTWDINIPSFDVTKDSIMVIHNTTVLTNNDYTISGNSLTIPNNTIEPIDKNTVSVIVFSNSQPISGGNYILPIANVDTLGGIKPDGVTLKVDPTTGVATVVGGGSVNLPISANDVTETINKQFIEGTLKSQITSNASVLNSQELRLNNLETTISNISSSDEKVKLQSNGTAGYLADFIDNNSITIVNDKLAVSTLQGLTATVSEINSLQGVNGNIQAQLNSLSSIGNYSTTVMNYSSLTSIIDPKKQDMVIVLNDETQMNKSTIYIYNGTNWVYSGEFKAGEVRDFTTNPIKLEIETSGILQKSKYEKQNASETSILDTNNNFTSTNVEDALVELFQYVNSGKSGVATSIGYPLNSSDNFNIIVQKINTLKSKLATNNTQKGVLTYDYEPLSQMIDKVLSIPNINLDGTIKKKSKINITAPYQLEITLDNPLNISDISSTLIEFIQGVSGTIHYNLDFNNGDSSNFIPNDNVEFDGVLKIRNNYSYDMIKNESWTSEGSVFEYELNKDNYSEINNMVVEY